MTKKTHAPETTEDMFEAEGGAPAPVETDRPELPERFSTGGATLAERDAWIAENRPDLMPPEAQAPVDETPPDEPKAKGGKTKPDLTGE